MVDKRLKGGMGIKERVKEEKRRVKSFQEKLIKEQVLLCVGFYQQCTEEGQKKGLRGCNLQPHRSRESPQLLC